MEQCAINPEQGQKVFESREMKGTAPAQVAQIKETAALLWCMINLLPQPHDNKEVGRLVALAKTDLESSVMWAVKAASRA